MIEYDRKKLEAQRWKKEGSVRTENTTGKAPTKWGNILSITCLSPEF
jgi:hypothetical protein